MPTPDSVIIDKFVGQYIKIGDEYYSFQCKTPNTTTTPITGIEVVDACDGNVISVMSSSSSGGSAFNPIVSEFYGNYIEYGGKIYRFKKQTITAVNIMDPINVFVSPGCGIEGSSMSSSSSLSSSSSNSSSISSSSVSSNSSISSTSSSSSNSSSNSSSSSSSSN